MSDDFKPSPEITLARMDVRITVIEEAIAIAEVEQVAARARWLREKALEPKGMGVPERNGEQRGALAVVLALRERLREANIQRDTFAEATRQPPRLEESAA